MKTKLVNPVWESLNETHKKVAINYGIVKFYNPDICNFGAIASAKGTAVALDNYAKLSEEFYIVGKERPEYSNSLVLKNEILCKQMVLENLIKPVFKNKIVKLDKSYVEEVYDLIWLGMPGYYKKGTFYLGNYYGIFIKGKLIAVAGERLQSNNFIEISAVVTNPAYRGNGYAKELVAYTSERILERNKTPILHVTVDNHAVLLYEKLGYKTIQEVFWRHFVRK